ncbi:MAG: lipopolysaccharide heptosyltransferase family protein [Betaproteobacteria bacterium]|nr:MAG: lipopolysaccharide heptosyltransferase family protein [Betaproteobacteria bacterium]
MPPTQHSPALPRKPLIVRLRNYIGDVVLTLPSLDRLHAAGYDLHLVGKPWLKSLLDAYPWSKTTYPKSIGQRRRVLATLADELTQVDSGFGQRINAVTFPTSFSSALEMRLAGLRGFGFAAEARSLLLAGRAKIVYGEHALDSYWRLTSSLLKDNTPPPPASTFRISAAADDELRAAFRQAGVTGKYIVLVPFAGGTFEKLDKKWAGFPALAEKLRAQGHQLLMAPGPDELSEASANFPGVVQIAKLGLGAYAAMMRDAQLTIANDTGPGHMAASVDGNLLSVLGPTKIEQWGARGRNVTILKSYPEWPSVDAVFDATRASLASP